MMRRWREEKSRLLVLIASSSCLYSSARSHHRFHFQRYSMHQVPGLQAAKIRLAPPGSEDFESDGEIW